LPVYKSKKKAKKKKRKEKQTQTGGGPAPLHYPGRRAGTVKCEPCGGHPCVQLFLRPTAPSLLVNEL